MAITILYDLDFQPEPQKSETVIVDLVLKKKKDITEELLSLRSELTTVL